MIFRIFIPFLLSHCLQEIWGLAVCFGSCKLEQGIEKVVLKGLEDHMELL